jgi:hypothetical protein
MSMRCSDFGVGPIAGDNSRPPTWRGARISTTREGTRIETVAGLDSIRVQSWHPPGAA